MIYAVAPGPDLVITAEETAEIPSEDGSYGVLLVPAVAVFRRSEFVAQAFKGHALENHAAGAGEGGQEQTLAAEDSGSDAPHHLNIVVDGWLEGDQMAGLHLQYFARPESHVHVISARMHEDQAGAGQLLQNEPFAAEQARA